MTTKQTAVFIGLKIGEVLAVVFVPYLIGTLSLLLFDSYHIDWFWDHPMIWLLGVWLICIAAGVVLVIKIVFPDGFAWWVNLNKSWAKRISK